MDAADATQPDVWMHIQAIGSPIASADPADKFVTTFDVVNITNGAIDSTWNDDDLNTVAGQLQGLLGSWANPHMSNDCHWTELRFYRRAFNPLANSQPFAFSGPPVKTYLQTVAGIGTGYQAPQVAMTSTERTAYPRHWGRNYWPRPASNQAISGGFIQSAQVDTFISSLQSVYATLMGAEFFPVVPVTQIQGGPARGLLTVHELQVDNLFDVQRRRRPNASTYKRVLGV
jgi:hypothetical protein